MLVGLIILGAQRLAALAGELVALAMFVAMVALWSAIAAGA